MSALTILHFCPQKNETSPKPGAPKVVNVQLNSVRPEQVSTAPGEVGPNDGIFASADGSSYLQINAASDATAAFFASGKKYKLTIEEVE